jgi:hypothetical protein
MKGHALSLSSMLHSCTFYITSAWSRANQLVWLPSPWDRSILSIKSNSASRTCHVSLLLASIMSDSSEIVDGEAIGVEFAGNDANTERM